MEAGFAIRNDYMFAMAFIYDVSVIRDKIPTLHHYWSVHVCGKDRALVIQWSLFIQYTSLMGWLVFVKRWWQLRSSFWFSQYDCIVHCTKCII